MRPLASTPSKLCKERVFSQVATFLPFLLVFQGFLPLLAHSLRIPWVARCLSTTRLAESWRQTPHGLDPCLGSGSLAFSSGMCGRNEAFGCGRRPSMKPCSLVGRSRRQSPFGSAMRCVLAVKERSLKGFGDLNCDRGA